MAQTSLRRTSKRKQIKDRVVSWIDEQDLKPGDRIASQNELAVMFDTTGVTVHKALRELCDAGLLYRQKGVGTFIAPSEPNKRTRTVCLVLPDSNLESPHKNPHYWPYVQKLYRAMIENVGDHWSFTTRVVTPATPMDEVVGDFDHYDGVFFHYTQKPRQLIRKLIERNRVPVASMGMPREDLDCLTVDHDQVAGSRAAVGHMIEAGHTRIGFIGSSQFWGGLSLQGYREALEEYGLPIDDARIMRIGEERPEAFRGASMLLSRTSDCDAIFVDSDMRALGVIECLRQRGIRVPEDISVMGYDGLDNATAQPPYLTTMDVPYGKMVATALDAFAEASDHATLKRHVSFIPQLLPGQTCTRRSRKATAEVVDEDAAGTIT